MKNFVQLFETYLMVLVHPFRIHQQFRYNLPIPNQEGHQYPPLSLAESLGISWVFALVQGLSKILILNFFLQTFLTLQSEQFPIIQEMIKSSGLSTYYFLLFSAALDVIFFPIMILAVTEMWAWVIRLYSNWLDPEAPKEIIADQITTHALSSCLFSIIPVIGGVIQFCSYFFLLYAGLRFNLGASRSLAWVILLTPAVIGLMTFSLFLVGIFCLVS